MSDTVLKECELRKKDERDLPQRRKERAGHEQRGRQTYNVGRRSILRITEWEKLA